ncbi:MAG: hypothetical protein E7173_00650 [Firmicutes bacterium]|nr:hypothetical protein [Bacillota bacterium]
MNQKYCVLKMKHSVKNIGKFMGIFIFVCVFFHGKINVQAQVFPPFDGWACQITNNAMNPLQCYMSGTQNADITYKGGTTHCGPNDEWCWQYDTGLFWSKSGSCQLHFTQEATPTLEDQKNENCDLQLSDVGSGYYKYPASYYESNWELQVSSTNPIVGIWDLEKNAGSNGSCPIVDGNIGVYDEEENKCYYSMYVQEPTGGSCGTIAGVTGRLQTFMTAQYCIYTLYGYEESDCVNAELDVSGKYLPNYEGCIVGSVDNNEEVDPYDGDIYCFDGASKFEPIEHYDGAYENKKHYYYFCPATQEIMGDYETVCNMGYNFMDEAAVVGKFGTANSGHIALYCEKSIEQAPPPPLPEPEPEPEPNPGDPVTGCEVIPASIRIWIKDTLNLVKYVVLVVVIVLGILDFLKAAGSGEAEAMKKAGTDFLKRVIAVIVLFLLPLIVDLILNLIEIYGADSTCL